MKKVVKLERHMFNQGFNNDPVGYFSDDWTANGDWMCHNSKLIQADFLSLIHDRRELTDKMIDGVLEKAIDESIRFYRTKERADVDGRQLVLFKAVDGKERRIQLRYVRYFGLKTLYSKDSEEDSMLWTKDKKFFVMPVKK